MDYSNSLHMLIQLLVIAGALNWGLIAYNGTDLVTKLTVTLKHPEFDRYVKIAVGVAGLACVYGLYNKQMMMH